MYHPFITFLISTAVDQATRKDWKHGYKRHKLKIPGPSSIERNEKDYTKYPLKKCLGQNEGNLRQRQGQNQSSYFLPNFSGQRMTVETELLLVYELVQGNSFQRMA